PVPPTTHHRHETPSRNPDQGRIRMSSRSRAAQALAEHLSRATATPVTISWHDPTRRPGHGAWRVEWADGPTVAALRRLAPAHAPRRTWAPCSGPAGPPRLRGRPRCPPGPGRPPCPAPPPRRSPRPGTTWTTSTELTGPPPPCALPTTSPATTPAPIR